MSFADRLTALLEELGRYRGENVFNPWRDVDPLDTGAGATSRRLRLLRHMRCEPRFVLVDGCVPRIGRGARITTAARPFVEASATIVWRTLYALGLEAHVVMWNAFPFHPHGAGNLRSNRTPTTAETRLGLELLEGVLALYPDARVLPVGRVAERAIAMLGKRVELVLRHPSMGGAQLFATGLRAAAGGA